jgi:hypothetical protein
MVTQFKLVLFYTWVGQSLLAWIKYVHILKNILFLKEQKKLLMLFALFIKKLQKIEVLQKLI